MYLQRMLLNQRRHRKGVIEGKQIYSTPTNNNKNFGFFNSTYSIDFIGPLLRTLSATSIPIQNYKKCPKILSFKNLVKPLRLQKQAERKN